MLTRVLRWAERRLRPRAAILLYHRVAEPPADPYLLCVSPRHFSEHMEVLRKETRLFALEALGHSAWSGDVPRRATAVTFDDGYADALYEAKPALDRYEVPATVYVTSGFMGTDREPFWDDLERLLLHPGTLPATLDLEIAGRTYHFELGEAAAYREDAYLRHRRWSTDMQRDPTPRQTLCRSLNALLRPLSDSGRRGVLDALRRWGGATEAGRASHRLMSPDELLRLAGDGLVEIGAHTETHPVLAAHPLEQQRAEIVRSKQALEQILGRPVRSFAYPFGNHQDYTQDTVAVVREAGFSSACSNFPGLVDRATDRFQLPRFMVLNWDGDELGRRLRQWFG